jgi:hypothetical protein
MQAVDQYLGANGEDALLVEAEDSEAHAVHHLRALVQKRIEDAKDGLRTAIRARFGSPCSQQ